MMLTRTMTRIRAREPETDQNMSGVSQDDSGSGISGDTVVIRDQDTLNDFISFLSCVLTHKHVNLFNSNSQLNFLIVYNKGL